MSMDDLFGGNDSFTIFADKMIIRMDKCIPNEKSS